MRIISKKQDYYDYYSKIFDPSGQSPIVYNRNDDVDVNINWRNDIGMDALERISHMTNFGYEFRDSKDRLKYRYIKFFAFAGKLYPFVFDRVNIDYEYHNFTIHDWQEFKNEREKHEENIKYSYRNSHEIDENFFDPIEIPNPEKKMCFASTVYHINVPWGLLQHKIGEDFFIRTLYHEETNVSLLKDYDFQNVFSPDQAYQLISMYIADAKNVEKNYLASNGEKIQSHGYDKSYSFRSNHPMNS